MKSRLLLRRYIAPLWANESRSLGLCSRIAEMKNSAVMTSTVDELVDQRYWYPRHLPLSVRLSQPRQRILPEVNGDHSTHRNHGALSYFTHASAILFRSAIPNAGFCWYGADSLQQCADGSGQPAAPVEALQPVLDRDLMDASLTGALAPATGRGIVVG